MGIHPAAQPQAKNLHASSDDRLYKGLVWVLLQELGKLLDMILYTILNKFGFHDSIEGGAISSSDCGGADLQRGNIGRRTDSISWSPQIRSCAIWAQIFPAGLILFRTLHSGMLSLTVGHSGNIGIRALPVTDSTVPLAAGIIDFRSG